MCFVLVKRVMLSNGSLEFWRSFPFYYTLININQTQQPTEPILPLVCYLIVASFLCHVIYMYTCTVYITSRSVLSGLKTQGEAESFYN